MTDSRASTRPPGSTNSFIGMAIFMGAWAMMLLALMFAYADVRLKLGVWPPPDEPRLPRDIPALATLVLATASFTLERARRHLDTRPSLRSPLMMGVLFLALQAIVWQALYRAGLHVGTPFGSIFYTLTIFHAAHVVVALIGLGALSTQSRSDPRFRTRLRNWAIFWHGLLVAWIVIFVGVYLV